MSNQDKFRKPLKFRTISGKSVPGGTKNWANIRNRKIRTSGYKFSLNISVYMKFFYIFVDICLYNLLKKFTLSLQIFLDNILNYLLTIPEFITTFSMGPDFSPKNHKIPDNSAQLIQVIPKMYTGQFRKPPKFQDKIRIINKVAKPGNVWVLLYLSVFIITRRNRVKII